MRKRVRSSANLTARQRVQRALESLPADAALPQIYAAVKRQKWPGRPATWQATVRRSLQEIRKSGGVSFSKKPGHYHRPPHSTNVVADRIQSLLEASFTVSSRAIEVAAPSKYAPYSEHRYTFDVEPTDTNAEDSAETIAQATLALRKWYSDYTAVSVYAQAFDTESGETVGYQWVNLAWSANPTVASGQAKFKMETYGIEGRYQVTEQIARIGFRVKE